MTEQISLNTLQEALYNSREVLSSKAFAMGLVKQAENLTAKITRMPGIFSVFALGYPFYILSKDLPNNYHVNEYNRFLQETSNALETYQPKDVWKCPSCARKKKLTEYKTVCYPCQDSSFKPRHLFRALPDVDMTVVVKDDELDTFLLQFEGIRTEIRTPDDDLYSTILRFNEGVRIQDSSKFALFDIHLMTQSTFMQSMAAVSESDFAYRSPVLSLRKGNSWVDGECLPFYSDFLFSLTPIGYHLEGNMLLKTILHEHGDTHGKEGILSLMNKLESPRMKSLLCDPSSSELIKANVYHRFFGH